MALDALTAIADAPKAYATKLAEFMQCIVLDLPETIDATDRQAYVYKVYNRLQAHDRLDDPAPFYDRAADQERPHGSLTDATKHIMQTLLRVS
jgi:hypothetical protein